jgi:hypothetical protein
VPKKITGGMTTNPALALLTDIKHLIDEVRQREATAALIKKLGNRVDFVPDLCLGLHRTCEQKKRSTEAQWYNSLGQSWHEICRLAQEVVESNEPAVVGQGSLEF